MLPNPTLCKWFVALASSCMRASTEPVEIECILFYLIMSEVHLKCSTQHCIIFNCIIII